MELKKETNEKQIYASRKVLSVIMFIIALAFLVGGLLLKFFAFNFTTPNGIDFYTALSFGVAGLSFTLLSFAIYVFVSRKELVQSPKKLAFILTTIIFTYLVNIILASYCYYYIFIGLTALTLATILPRKDVFMANAITGILVMINLFTNVAYVGGTIADYLPIVCLMVLDIFFGAIVVAVLPESNKRTIFILEGILLETVALGLVFLIATYFSDESLVANVVLTIICTYAPVFVALLLQPLFTSLFNILSNNKLYELTDHTSPLIKRLVQEAPGTFNHCLSVASYAEVCAIAIGENPLLAKACAYYHDIGKLENPKYFAENQSNANLHDGLLPEVSAEIVRKHTIDGYYLCEKYRIPREIRDVTVQHHGTLPMAVFYHKAKNLTDSDVDIYDYSYHGVTPESKIAAIMMICDAAEAAIRASGKPTAEEVEKILTTIINDRIARHQFDNCDITLKDLNTIKNTIIEVYGGHVHTRLKYPSGK